MWIIKIKRPDQFRGRFKTYNGKQKVRRGDTRRFSKSPILGTEFRQRASGSWKLKENTFQYNNSTFMIWGSINIKINKLKLIKIYRKKN